MKKPNFSQRNHRLQNITAHPRLSVMDKALVGIDLTVDGNVITAPVGEVELEEGSKQLKLSHANKPHRSPIVHSIDHGAYLSRLSSEATAINSPVLQNIIGINSSLGGLQDPDVIINHAAAMGTALSPVGTPTVTLRAYRRDRISDHCDLPSINTAEFSRPPHRLFASRVADIECILPFTEQESTSICLKSALVMSRVFRQLSSPNPDIGLEADGKASGRSRSPRGLPDMACCTLQSVYAISMLLSKIRTALCSGDLSSCYYLLDRPTPGTDVQDEERLIEELQQWLNALSASIWADAVFEGMAAVAREMEGTLCAITD
ncbi:hypothetical protein CNMCM8927_004531 [Aspergillus lentulus]|uniref:Transcription factor domain-containing protein n=1 Tax=Aspergillus lentulus TaxID=293939 RepID=A0AAN6BKM6_ASPLE|nr:hypothetical protein CNMCM8060_004919 [Aspergillus lentulus]KAF4188501.1 hypothetical protein CNMCM8694_004677 [Aspergillus lentulus]KAF4199875.1 hypothetical protein CNMCM8927_004531 [Aspergillus lentulus]